MQELINEFDASLKQLYPKPPSQIYHYTNSKGLIGIITSGKIRASHAQFMNDRTEFIHGKEIMCRCLEKAENEESDRDVADLFKWAKIRLIDQRIEPLDIYLACFTEDPDSLSQWITYSDDAHGYVLGFDVGSEYGFAKEYVMQVIYDPEEQKALVEKLTATISTIAKKQKKKIPRSLLPGPLFGIM